MRGTTVVASSLVVALAVPAGYGALGGGRYDPPGLSDPCEGSRWEEPRALEVLAELLAEAALDAAACRLRVSRETLILVVARGGSDELAAEIGLGRANIDRAIRTGVDDAIAEAQSHGAIGFVEAAFLRARARELSVESLIGLLIDAKQRRRLARQLESARL